MMTVPSCILAWTIQSTVTATVDNNKVDKMPAKETFIQRIFPELKQQGVYPAGGRPNA